MTILQPKLSTWLIGGKQLSLRFVEGCAYAVYEQTTAKKRTNREKFLDEMVQVLH